MPEFKPITQFLRDLEADTDEKEIDRIRFWHIFLVWTGIVVLFGLVYYFLRSPYGSLQYTSGGTVANIWDAIYFSFVSATTTGFGDIVPVGAFKIIAVIEVVSGLILLAAVTSKLVSLKQDAITSEIYQISLRERINRFRDNLLLYRQHLSDLMGKVEEESVRDREIRELHHFFSQFDDTLREIRRRLRRSDRNRYIQDLDPVDIELLANSIVASFERTEQLLAMLDEHEEDWQRATAINTLESAIDRGDDVIRAMEASGALSLNVMENKEDAFAEATSSIRMLVDE